MENCNVMMLQAPFKIAILVTPCLGLTRCLQNKLTKDFWSALLLLSLIKCFSGPHSSFPCSHTGVFPWNSLFTSAWRPSYMLSLCLEYSCSFLWWTDFLLMLFISVLIISSSVKSPMLNYTAVFSPFLFEYCVFLIKLSFGTDYS